VIAAEVNPALLAWAREQSGYQPDAVARRVGVAPDRLAAWESGDRKPTVRQAQVLARVYRRPFGVFFLPQPPALRPLAAEYRRLRGITPGVESPEFRLAVRGMSSRRETALELRDELGQEIPEFTLHARLSEGPQSIGWRLRQMLGITLNEQLAWRDEWQAWRAWRQAAETCGALVFLFPKVPLSETRGLSLLEFPLPAVGINSREQSPGARIFTLLHELVHVALALGHEERVALREIRSEGEWNDVERFAEEAASEAVIPGEALDEALGHNPVPASGWDVTAVRVLARRFRVTPLAMATRLRAANVLSWEAYGIWKAEWDEYVRNLRPRKGGMATPVEKALARAGRPFAQLVLEAMDANRISAADACHHLELRFDHLETLRYELRTASSPVEGDAAQ
jgi:Zn-dependent peptidase ImmA (M78 family)/DNA-binding XRE family transcriptional regulator